MGPDVILKHSRDTSGGCFRPCWAEAAASSERWLWPQLKPGCCNCQVPSGSSPNPVRTEQQIFSEYENMRHVLNSFPVHSVLSSMGGGLTRSMLRRGLALLRMRMICLIWPWVTRLLMQPNTTRALGCRDGLYWNANLQTETRYVHCEATWQVHLLEYYFTFICIVFWCFSTSTAKNTININELRLNENNNWDNIHMGDSLFPKPHFIYIITSIPYLFHWIYVYSTY